MIRIYKTEYSSPVQYNTIQHYIQYNTIQYNTIQYNTIQYNTIQYTTTQRNTTQHNTTQHNTTQHNTTQHNTTQHNTTQHNTTQHNTTPPHIIHLCFTDSRYSKRRLDEDCCVTPQIDTIDDNAENQYLEISRSDRVQTALRFVQQLCEGHNLKMQNSLRTSAYNIIDALLNVLQSLVPPSFPKPYTPQQVIFILVIIINSYSSCSYS